MADPKQPSTAEIVRFSDFLAEPGAGVPGAAASGVQLEAPGRDGLGSAPAPAMGYDDATIVDPDVWFAEAAEADVAEPATVLIPEDVVRIAQEFKERRYGPAANDVETVEVALDDDEEDELPDGLGLAARLWHRRSRLAVPTAVFASAAAVILSLTALARPSPSAAATEVRPAAAPAKTPIVGGGGGEAAQATACIPLAPLVAPEHREERPSVATPYRRRSGALKAPASPPGKDRRFRRAMRNGRAHFERDDFRAALVWYRRATRLDPGAAEAWYGAALASFELYRDDAARRGIERALKVEPAHADSHLLLGFLLQWSGEKAVAAEHYEQYLALAPAGEWAGEVQAVLSQLGR